MILAIDQGTTATTCLVVDDELTVHGRGTCPIEQRFPRPGWVEHDPEQLWTALADRNVFVLPGTLMHTPEYFRVSLTASDAMVTRALPIFEEVGQSQRI